MQIIDPDHPFYRPLWRRVLIVAFCLGWAGIELYNGQVFWVGVSGIAGLYAAWILLLRWNPKPLAAEPVATADNADSSDKEH